MVGTVSIGFLIISLSFSAAYLRYFLIYTFSSLVLQEFKSMCAKQLHAPGPNESFYTFSWNLCSPAKKGAVPRWPSLTITLLLDFLIVCTIGAINGRDIQQDPGPGGMSRFFFFLAAFDETEPKGAQLWVTLFYINSSSIYIYDNTQEYKQLPNPKKSTQPIPLTSSLVLPNQSEKLQLNLYWSYKQNQDKMYKNKETKIWNNSPCCMNYVTNNISVFNVPRFQIGSIYHRDQVDKPKKIFNQFEKPELLLQDFRRQIIQASHPKYNTAAKKNKQMTEKQKSKARSMSMTTPTSLYQVPSKTEYKYDIHGYRAHQVGEYSVKQIENKVKTSRRHFSFGRRIDLSRPLNFFPGPGTYYSDQNETSKRAFARTCMQFRKNQNHVQNPQTERATSNKISTKQSEHLP